MKTRMRKAWFVAVIIFLLLITCSTVEAYPWGSFRVRRIGWSMYAHALIPRGDFHYSPYAFGHGHNGLVSDSYSSVPYWPVVRREVYRQIPEVRSYQPRRTIAQDDARKVIWNILKNKGVVSDFRMKNLLTGADGKAISIDFVFIGNRRIVIKFWDIEKMSGAVGRRKEYYGNYIAKWQEFWPGYLAKGGKIYLITTTNKKEIEKVLPKILSACFQ